MQPISFISLMIRVMARAVVCFMTVRRWLRNMLAMARCCVAIFMDLRATARNPEVRSPSRSGLMIRLCVSARLRHVSRVRRDRALFICLKTNAAQLLRTRQRIRAIPMVRCNGSIFMIPMAGSRATMWVCSAIRVSNISPKSICTTTKQDTTTLT